MDNKRLDLSAGGDLVDLHGVARTSLGTADFIRTGGENAGAGFDPSSDFGSIGLVSLADRTTIAGELVSFAAINGTPGNDVLTGTDLKDTIQGLGGNDTIYGLGDNDYLDGGDGNDIVYGGTGDDSLYGGLNSATAADDFDILDGGDGNDRFTLRNQGSIDGGTGQDTASIDFFDLTSGITIDLTNMWTGGTGQLGAGTIRSVEVISDLGGSQGNDSIIFGAAATQRVYIHGYTGNDRITGGGFSDTLVGEEGEDVLDGAGGDDKLEGGSGQDTLIGGAGNDSLFGGAGNDKLDGGDGNDVLSDTEESYFPSNNTPDMDTMDGGAGKDVFYVTSVRDRVDGGADFDTVSINMGRSDPYFKVPVNIDLTNVWTGGVGSLGDGTIRNVEAISALILTMGDDVIRTGDYATSAIVGTGLGVNGKAGVYLEGGNDVAYGGSLTDTIWGGAGNDTIDGGAGDDTLWGDDDIGFVDAGDDTLFGGAGNDDLEGGRGTDMLFGGDGNDFLNGGYGNDVLEGGKGDDVLQGLDGDDTASYFGAESAVTVDLRSTNSQNTLGAGTDRLLAIDNLLGSRFNDSLTGNDAVNVLQGGAGDDALDGAGGADRMFGGIGNDTFKVDRSDDVLFENAGDGTDTVISTSNFYLYANIENLTLAAGAGNSFGVGNDLDNAILGNEGANTLLGGAGADTIRAGAGVDILYGEAGNDQLFGDAGNDVLIGGAGDDTLDGGTGGDSLYGEDGNDTLIGGSDFVFDQLVGGNGDDVLRGDSGLGDYDYLYGNAGNDSFYVDTPADLVFEQAGEGTDTVYASITGGGYYLYANIENLVLLGNTPFGVGNELANRLTGNAIGNYLLGGAGNDILNGKGGNDVLFGEAGADTFVFERGTGGDVIGDFLAGTDKIDLSAFGFASFGAVQAATGQNGSDSFINLGNGDLIVLNGVARTSLSASDFILTAGQSAGGAFADVEAVGPVALVDLSYDSIDYQYFASPLSDQHDWVKLRFDLDTLDFNPTLSRGGPWTVHLDNPYL